MAGEVTASENSQKRIFASQSFDAQKDSGVTPEKIKSGKKMTTP
jgi:hypothetical protein